VVVRVLSIAAFALFACTDGDDDNPDTGITDAGFLSDGCYLDNPPRDSGINLPACNPANGQGCEVSSGRYCVWNYQTDDGSCRCLGDAPKARGEACNEFLQDWAAGNVCIQVGHDVAATCHPVCTQEDPRECDALNTNQETFACFALQRSNGTATEQHGLCVSAGQACNPLDDQCPVTETCVLVSISAAVCRPSGNVPLGGDCSLDECEKGGVCVPLLDQNGNPLGTLCYEPCDLVTPTCMMGACTDVGIEGFGLCI
jgi:hypothetical protein